MNINSTDYHDFVIKNGKLIGEFEQMYQKSEGIPWHQDDQDDWLDIRLTTELLKEYAPFDYICDVGCGLGYILDILKRNVGKSGSQLVGYDISPTSLVKAKEIFPDIETHKLDLMKSNEIRQAENKTCEKRLFVIRGTLWYVFPNMKNVIDNIRSLTTEGDLLLVSQNFPPLVSKFVGKDVIPTPDSIISWFGKYFKPIKSVWVEDHLSDGNDNWFIGIFTRTHNE